MICFDNSFISELINFWFGGEIPKGLNSHFIFAITTFFVSLILVILNSILVKYKSVDLLKLKFKDGDDGNNNKFIGYLLWAIGTFLISFILTTTEIVNIKIISSVIVGFTWDKLFTQLSKMTTNDKNPSKY
jgi:hypothetical protein